MRVSETHLFHGLSDGEIASLLRCLGAVRRSYRRGEIILAEGDATNCLGLVLSGMVLITSNDAWGNVSILGHVPSGSVFAEVYACLSDLPLPVSAEAAEASEILFLNVGRMLAPCSNACPFHARLSRNLLTVCAEKSLRLSEKIRHTSAKTIRGRLISYFSECSRQSGSSSFVLPYGRQQLADYLNVDRCALCSEMSKMQREGLIKYHGRGVELLRRC